MPTTAQYLNGLKRDRNQLVTNLINKGVTDVSTNMKITQLVDKVNDIPSGEAPQLLVPIKFMYYDPMRKTWINGFPNTAEEGGLYITSDCMWYGISGEPVYAGKEDKVLDNSFYTDSRCVQFAPESVPHVDRVYARSAIGQEGINLSWYYENDVVEYYSYETPYTADVSHTIDDMESDYLQFKQPFRLFNETYYDADPESLIDIFGKIGYDVSVNVTKNNAVTGININVKFSGPDTMGTHSIDSIHHILIFGYDEYKDRSIGPWNLLYSSDEPEQMIFNYEYYQGEEQSLTISDNYTEASFDITSALTKWNPDNIKYINMFTVIKRKSTIDPSDQQIIHPADTYFKDMLVLYYGRIYDKS